MRVLKIVIVSSARAYIVGYKQEMDMENLIEFLMYVVCTGVASWLFISIVDRYTFS